MKIEHNFMINVVHIWLKNEGPTSRRYEVITQTRKCTARRPTPHRWGLKGLRGKKAMALTLILLL